MAKRLIFIGLGLCLFVLVAAPPAFSWCALRVVLPWLSCSDLCPNAELDKIGNAVKNATQVCFSFSIQAANGEQCWNGPWNAGTQSSDTFNNPPQIVSLSQVTEGDVIGKGKAVVELTGDECLSWEYELWPALAGAACPNENWHYVRWVDGTDFELDPYGIPIVPYFCRENTQTADSGYWCQAQIEEMYFYTGTYQEWKGEILSGGGYCMKCELFDPDTHDPADVICEGDGNPMVCDETSLSNCIAAGLVTACDNVIY